MPNHVHLIAVPKTEDGLRRAIGEAHRRYTRRINFREKWRGYLWQGRFASFIMDEPYLLAAARYVELNPVRAKLVEHARQWPWGSAKAHLKGPRRPFGQSQTTPGNGWRLESVFEKRRSGGGTPGFARTWANRSAAGELAFLGSFRESCGSRLEAAKARPQAATQ